MPVYNDPNYDPSNNPTLDPSYQADFDQQKNSADEVVKEQARQEAENTALIEQQKQDDQFEQWSHKIPVIGPLKAGMDTAALGVGDFAADAIGLVPWLKPIDQWWDDNSPRHSHPSHKLVRDASSVIIPSVLGGTFLVGGARAAVAARAITLPKFAHTLGTVAAYTGVDTTVAAISSHSKKDDNLAGTLNNWLGWGIPWATRPGDDPDTRWKKNVYEAAGMAGAVELLGVAFAFGRKTKLFPKDIGAEEAITAKKAPLEAFDNPVTASIETTRQSRNKAIYDETVDAIKADPDGLQYNSFVNDVGEDISGKAVINIDPDPLMAKVHQTQIQNNVGTLSGRAASVTDENFNKSFLRAIDGNERAKQLDQLFDSISPNVDAVVIDGTKEVHIAAEQMNRAVDNLTQAVYGKDLSFKEFEFIVDDMKTSIFNSNQVLDEENWTIASQAFKNAYDKIFDPNQMRASSMLVQQTADNISDVASAARMLGEDVDTSRQMGIIFDKLNLLGQEVKTNQYIVSKANEYKLLKKAGNVEDVVKWMDHAAIDFEDFLTTAKAKGNKLADELHRISNEHPNYYRAFIEVYDATDGDVDTLHKLHRLTESKIGFLKKAFIDGEPEVPSVLVQQMHGVKINSLLAGMAPVRAALGNSMLTFAKPISVFAGAALTGEAAVLKRAMWTFGGITENMKRGFKVMQKEWDFATKYPEEAMMRGRTDMSLAKMEELEYMETMAKSWEAEGESGKVAMWNMAKGLGWFNKQSFSRFGTNALYAIDGFTNSFMASGMARARAYDELFEATKGAPLLDKFQELQRNLYNEAFDQSGLLTDAAAKFASQEIALNLDSNLVNSFQDFLNHVPAAKSIFLFPRTGVNAFDLGWTFSPASNLGPALTKARRVLGAKTEQQKIAALLEHGIDATMDPDLAFRTLKSEYIGRQIMGSSVVMGAAVWALEENLTGNGPQDAAEKRRMMQMGWQPLSIKNPITGQWHSYRGFEPFDKLLSLTADAVFQANRVDQAITEDFLRKTAYAISMSGTNGTFISGFKPLVGLLSGDQTAWTQFLARQANMSIPYAGVRNILNKMITPQLKDVENDFFAQMANMNKFMFKGNEYLQDSLDVYTGKPINYQNQVVAAANSLLPTFNVNGGMEPWRQWLLSTGWDGLQKSRVNKITGDPLSTHDRRYINNWIAKNANLRSQVIKMMSENDGYWTKKMKAYVKARGLKSQKQYPVKEFLVHKELDRIHDQAFDAAWASLQVYNHKYTTLGQEQKWRNLQLQAGDTEGATQTQQKVQQLQREVRK